MPIVAIQMYYKKSYRIFFYLQIGFLVSLHRRTPYLSKEWH